MVGGRAAVRKSLRIGGAAGPPHSTGVRLAEYRRGRALQRQPRVVQRRQGQAPWPFEPANDASNMTMAKV
jgi:hypothetical protein